MEDFTYYIAGQLDGMHYKGARGYFAKAIMTLTRDDAARKAYISSLYNAIHDEICQISLCLQSPEVSWEDTYWKEYDEMQPILDELWKNHNSIKGPVNMYITKYKIHSISSPLHVFEILENIPDSFVSADKFFVEKDLPEFSEAVNKYLQRFS